MNDEGTIERNPVIKTLAEAYDAGRAAGALVERKDVVAWLRQAPARMKKQQEAGAGELHYMHTAGQLAAAAALAECIERGDHVPVEKP